MLKKFKHLYLTFDQVILQQQKNNKKTLKKNPLKEIKFEVNLSFFFWKQVMHSSCRKLSFLLQKWNMIKILVEDKKNK